MHLTPALIWFLVALVLGGVEILTLSFFLLWPALAALIVSLIAWIFPGMAWGWQIAIFGVVSVALLIPGRRWAKKFMQKKSQNLVNERGEQLVGKLATIVSGDEGIYRSKLGDSEWSTRSRDKELKEGDLVRVTGVDGITLEVEKA